MRHRWWLAVLLVGLISLVSVIASGCGIEQKRQRAGLQITTVNATAAAYLNGTYLNKTPLIEKSLRPGTYTIKLVADDTSLAPFEEQMTLTSGTLATLTWKPANRPEYASSVIYQLEPLASNQAFWRRFWPSETEKTTGDLKIVSVPDNAIISLAETTDRQFTPFVYTALPAGPIDYSVFLPSYETHQHTLDIKPGYRTTAYIKLAKNPPDLEGEPVDLTLATTSALLATPNVAASSGAKQSATQSGTPALPTILITSTGFLVDGVEVVRVRVEPSSTAEVIENVPVGSRLPYAGELKDGWYRVHLQEKIGWVSSQYAQMEGLPNATATPLTASSSSTSR